MSDGLGKLTRRKADTYVAPKRVEIPKVTVQDIPRPSIQRQSQSLTRLRKLSEQQKEADKKREEEKRITGLRRAKVPLMVYSCGGFTRCFRIARFYDVDGPPIGVTYDANSPVPWQMGPCPGLGGCAPWLGPSGWQQPQT